LIAGGILDVIPVAFLFKLIHLYGGLIPCGPRTSEFFLLLSIGPTSLAIFVSPQVAVSILMLVILMCRCPKIVLYIEPEEPPGRKELPNMASVT